MSTGRSNNMEMSVCYSNNRKSLTRNSEHNGLTSQRIRAASRHSIIEMAMHQQNLQFLFPFSQESCLEGENQEQRFDSDKVCHEAHSTIYNH